MLATAEQTDKEAGTRTCGVSLSYPSREKLAREEERSHQLAGTCCLLRPLTLSLPLLSPECSRPMATKAVMQGHSPRTFPGSELAA
jgi:hypothetical protein